ncbi:MAG: cyclic dehypoxanthinyl futalosine synthase [bacterium]|nr:cyclic dehypoxanthinyl futalosine synthase [bacterium]
MSSRPAPVETYTLPRRSSPVALELLEEALTRRLTGGELLLMFEEAALHDLGRTAHALRLQRCDPELVTYVVDRNVTYTNLCYVDCEFCAFNRHKGDDDAYWLSLDEIRAKVRSVFDAGGSQILLQGGHHPNEKVETYETLLATLKSEFPSLWIHGFSPNEIQHFAKVSKLPTLEVTRRLQAAGLDSIPGGGAEILNDRVRALLAPKKTTAREWIEIMEEAHYLGLPTTATMMFAHVETYPERIEHLLRLRESQDRTGGYTAFIPWTFQSGSTPLSRKPELMAQVEARGYLGAQDYLRTLAIARIALDNFANIQASWVTQGKSVGQLTLLFGANDLGSTMMEESVVSAAGTTHPLTQRDLDGMIRGAGFTPARRDNGYRVLQVGGGGGDPGVAAG